MSDDTDDDWPELQRENPESQSPGDARDTNDAGDELVAGAVDEGWEDDFGTTADNSTDADPMGQMTCFECGDEMLVWEGSVPHECSCGHQWRGSCVPADVVDETAP